MGASFPRLVLVALLYLHVHSGSTLVRDIIHFPCSRGRGRNPSPGSATWPLGQNSTRGARNTEKRKQDEGILSHHFHSDLSIFLQSSSPYSIISPSFVALS